MQIGKLIFMDIAIILVSFVLGVIIEWLRQIKIEVRTLSARLSDLQLHLDGLTIKTTEALKFIQNEFKGQG